MAKYEVGYGKPPKSGQFRKGQSGNPKGRPKKHRTLAEDVRRVANETVTLRTEDGTRRVSKRTALVRRIMNDALKGDKQASRDMVRLILAADDAATLEAATQDVRADLGEEDQAILERWVKRIGKDAASEG